MSKLVRLDPEYWAYSDYGHWCPACNTMHEIAVSKKNASGASWSFDGNLTNPTFSPSINYRLNMPDMKGYNADAGSRVCHYFITAGKIQYCGDCTHDLRGQVVDLPDFPTLKPPTCERL
jgi:Family of unknown function (DUF6527)